MAFEKQRELKLQLEDTVEVEQRAKVIKSVTLKEIKVMLVGIIEDLKNKKTRTLLNVLARPICLMLPI